MACPSASITVSSEEEEKEQRLIDVMFLCDEWKSSKGGLSTFNREFAINLAETTTDSMKIHCYVSRSDDQDKEDAEQLGVNLITAQTVPGSQDPLDWLKTQPPELPYPHIVIGHGRKLGIPAWFLRRATGCKWIQFVHVFCEDLGKFKETTATAVTDTIEENEEKHKKEIESCKAADAVIAVGSRLQRKYSRSLPNVAVEIITPGILKKFCNESIESGEHAGVLSRTLNAFKAFKFNVFMFGRATFEDLTLKGYDIVANAIGSLGGKFELTFVGSSPGEHRNVEQWFLNNTCIKRKQITIRGYCTKQDELKEMFHQSDLVAVPSRTEGFGLVGLEAISSGVPVLVSDESGIAEALQKVEGGNTVIVGSDEDEDEWARRISEVSSQSPEERQTSAKQLRENYRRVYPWRMECERFKGLIEKVVKTANDALSSQFHSTSSTSESPQKKEWEKSEQKTKIMETVKLEDALSSEFHSTSSTSESPQKKEQWEKSEQIAKMMEKVKLEDALSSEFHSTSSASESPQKKEQWEKSEQKTKIMETVKLEGTLPFTAVPTTGHGKELRGSLPYRQRRKGMFPLPETSSFDPKEEPEERCMKEWKVPLPPLYCPLLVTKKKLVIRNRKHTAPSPSNVNTVVKKKSEVSGELSDPVPCPAGVQHGDSIQGIVENTACSELLAGADNYTQSISSPAIETSDIERGVPVETRGWTHLHSAAVGGSEVIIETLLSSGLDINSSTNYGITPLMVAAANGHERAVNLLLSKGADPHLKDFMGRNLLHAAAYGGNTFIVESMLSCDIDIDSKDERSATSLIFAVINDHVEVVKYLLQRGADISLKYGFTKRNVLHIASQYGSVAAIEMLLSYELKPDSRDGEGNTPLALAAAYGQKKAVDCLLEHGADPSLKGKIGWSLLHFVAVSGNVIIIETMLSKGLDINARGKTMCNDGTTPLMVAAVTGKERAVNLLLSKGADPHLKNFMGKNLLHAAAEGGNTSIVERALSFDIDIDSKDEGSATPLIIAVKGNHVEVVKYLLQRGADISLTYGPDKGNVLHIASQEGSVAVIIEMLLSYDLRPDPRDGEGNTPLAYAAAFGQIEAVNCLLEHGADPFLKGQNGWSLLHFAAQSGNVVIIETMLSKGLDIDSRAQSLGITPAMVSIRFGKLEALKYLLEKGADGSLKTSEGQFSHLSLAVKAGSVAAIELLLSHGCSIDDRDNQGETPLMHAAVAGNTEVLKYLLAQGADPLLRNNLEFGLLHLAALSSNFLTIEAVLSENFDINARCTDLGLTPLLACLVSGKLKAANYLLERGADEHLKSERGWTVLTAAAMSGDVAAIEMLLKRGHNPNSRDGCDKTPLMWAAENGNKAAVEYLLPLTH